MTAQQEGHTSATDTAAMRTPSSGWACAGCRLARLATGSWAVTFPDGLTGFYATEAAAVRAAERWVPTGRPAEPARSRARMADAITAAIDRSPTDA